MTHLRGLTVAGILVVTAALAFFLRDAVYAMVIVPLAYLLWLGKYYYTAIPQLFLWVLLLIILFVTLGWNFIPEAQPARRKEHKRERTEGQIAALVLWMYKAQKGNYFKWQLANRLGRISRRLTESSGLHLISGSHAESVQKYFEAGLNSSFVDFPTPRHPFHHSAPTPLDLDPKDAVDYLESQMELNRDRHS